MTAPTTPVVTDGDRSDARSRVEPLARRAVWLGLVLVACAVTFAGLIDVLISDSVTGASRLLMRTGIAVAVVLPLLWWVASRAKRHGVEASAQRVAESRLAATEANRREFAGRLSNAFEMSSSEGEALAIVEDAVEMIATALPFEVLLADHSHAHLERVAETRDAEPPACPVSSPTECVAARRGQLMVFPSRAALDACPKLKRRDRAASSAVCAPVAIMGRTVGVVHAVSEKVDDFDEERVERFRILASQLGGHIGMQRAMAETELQATTDPLTGLSNRRRLEDEMRSLLLQRQPFTVVMADLDQFKSLNDRHGHESGDRALRAFADCLRDATRADDVCCRYGGEEFVLLLPHANADQADLVVGRVRERLALAAASGAVPHFTSSFGVVESRPGTTVDELLRAADAALYEAKETGRDRVVHDRDHSVHEQAADASSVG